MSIFCAVFAQNVRIDQSSRSCTHRTYNIQDLSSSKTNQSLKRLKLRSDFQVNEHILRGVCAECANLYVDAVLSTKRGKQ